MITGYAIAGFVPNRTGPESPPTRGGIGLPATSSAPTGPGRSNACRAQLARRTSDVRRPGRSRSFRPFRCTAVASRRYRGTWSNLRSRRRPGFRPDPRTPPRRRTADHHAPRRRPTSRATMSPATHPGPHHRDAPRSSAVLPTQPDRNSSIKAPTGPAVSYRANPRLIRSCSAPNQPHNSGGAPAKLSNRQLDRHSINSRTI